MAKQKHIVFTGGGTLGHVMPNLPLIEHYQKEGWKVSYIGSKTGEERAKIEGVLPVDLTPEQWLQHFYDQRKGSGKLATNSPTTRAGALSHVQ